MFANLKHWIKNIIKQSYLFEVNNFGFRPVTKSDIGYLLSLDAHPETI